MLQVLVPRKAADVLPPLPAAEDAAASPAAAAAAAPDTMLHACESLWTFLRQLNVFLMDVRAGKFEWQWF